MNHFLQKFVTGIFAAGLLGICSTASAGINAGDYVVDRAHDFLDIFRLRVGAPDGGHGIGAKARVTSLAQVGYVNFEGYYTGLNRRGFGTSHEDRQEGGVSVVYASEHMMETLRGNVFLDESTDWANVRDRRLERKLPYWDDGQGDYLGVGAEVVTPLIGLDVGVYPSQAVDFVGGFFLLDPYLDDRVTLAREPWEPLHPTVAPEADLGAATQKRQERLAEIRSSIQGYEDEEAEADEISIEDAQNLQLILDDKPIGELSVDESEPLTDDSIREIMESSEPVHVESKPDAPKRPSVVEITPDMNDDAPSSASDTQ